MCDLRKLGGERGRKCNEWWNDEVKQLVRQRKEACIHNLQGREERWWAEYERKNKEGT